jgi:hypothetical protein
VVKHIPDYIQHLVDRFFEGSITAEEKKKLDDWYHSLSSSHIEVVSGESGEVFGSRVKNRLNRIIRKSRNSPGPSRIVIMRAVAAALIIGISIIAFTFLLQNKEQKKFASSNKPARPATDMSPGTNKAMLTLGNGSTIILDSISGTLGKDGGIDIVKKGDGQVEYQDDNIQHNQSAVYNTISTPRGGQYEVALADGTNVWLNASSSIRFPVQFNDSIREVEMTGEVYFEVAHNPSKPFRVKVKDNYINVLGTHFNVMAYDDEPSINTTLLQGSVKVESQNSSRLISPGQEAIAERSGSIKIIKDADVEEAIAWKNGYFQFNRSDIKSIMHQVERWYDADVRYAGDVKLHFTGQVSRSVNVSELLRKLELTNEVHFKIEGKRITVLP